MLMQKKTGLVYNLSIQLKLSEDALKALEAGEIQVLAYNITSSSLTNKYTYLKLSDYTSSL